MKIRDKELLHIRFARDGLSRCNVSGVGELCVRRLDEDSLHFVK
jgi:hypothetical protein